MHLETLTFDADAGWSTSPFPPLDSEQTLVIVFGAPSFGESSEPLAQLRRAYPQSKHIGCSTSGEIHGAAVSDRSLSVAIARFDHTDLGSATASVQASEESFSAGAHLASELTREDLKAVLVLSDGLNVNGSDLVAGINDALPDSVVVTGGLAGDGDRFEQTWVLGADGPRSGLVTAVGLYGDRVRVGHGSRGGWDLLGPERTVTRSDRNVLFELDGKPALQLYKEYLGERAAELPASALLFPLSLRADGGAEKNLVRTVLAVNEDDQSMTFAGNIPEGHRAQLMRANFERLIDGAAEAAERTRATGVGSGPVGLEQTLAIAISCVGRRLILGERVEEEVEAALGGLPAGTRQVGFYSYGEISPHTSGHCDLHNQTMTLTTIDED